MAALKELIALGKTIELAQADPDTLKELQTKLKELYYYTGEVDGIYGDLTAHAWARFKDDTHQSNPFIVGPGSLKLLMLAKPTRSNSPYAEGYLKLWNTVSIQSSKVNDCDYVIAHKFLTHKNVYDLLEKDLGIPWYVIAVIHSRESDCNFDTHLFNGDPLDARTVNEPAGQPTQGYPPFSWGESAKAALIYDGLDQVKNWNIASTLYELEKYNGLGYFKLNINSPYLWAGTNHYKSGKFISDGHFDYGAVDEQLGCAALLKRMAERGIINV